MEKLFEVAEQAECSPSRAFKAGIDWLFSQTNGDLAAAYDYVSEKSPYGPKEGDTRKLEISLNPTRKAYLGETIRRLNSAPGDRKGDLTETPVKQAAARQVIDELSPEDIDKEEEFTQEELNQKKGFQYYPKLPGRDRGGQQVRFDITKKAKKKMDEKADQISWKTARVARECMREMLDWIEEAPEEAYDYIKEDSDLYQPPHSGGYQYAYQFYVSILLKMRLKRKRWELDNGPGKEDGKLTQREIMQAAARYAIEDFNEDLGLVPDIDL
jgi:hypothetical protein